MGRKRILDLGDGITEYFTPNNISSEYASKLWIDVRSQVKDYARILIKNDGWRFYVVNQSRGRCYFRERVITIPAWVFKRTLDYREWYISHEMAHAWNYKELTNDNHGPCFMHWLKQICPADCVHYELGYKPRNAAAAGIVDPSQDNIYL